MAKRGSNLPDFRAAQLEFAAHIRDPDSHPRPADVEARRMRIYVELFYNNIERFLASGFPVAKKVLGAERWHRLVRAFVHRHPSDTPYFLEIGQEFLTFLSERMTEAPGEPLPDFLLELCHYEWVELALSVSELEIPVEGYDAFGDLLENSVVVSPLIWCLGYRWPVHQIGPDHVPTEPPPEGTHLIVYRRRNDQVSFMVVNPATLKLVERLKSGLTGREALEDLHREAPELDSKVVYEQGLATLERLRDAEILLGARSADARVGWPE